MTTPEEFLSWSHEGQIAYLKQYGDIYLEDFLYSDIALANPKLRARILEELNRRAS